MAESSRVAHLRLPQQLLELVLRQQPVVLHEGRHLRRPLRLVVHRAVDLHVLVEDGQEPLLALRRSDVRIWGADPPNSLGWVRFGSETARLEQPKTTKPTPNPFRKGKTCILSSPTDPSRHIFRGGGPQNPAAQNMPRTPAPQARLSPQRPRAALVPELLNYR